ncbi:ABC transporter permease [Rhizobium sp. J15]|nr:ABC transporter permease [Rhizobium sp. J15]
MINLIRFAFLAAILLFWQILSPAYKMEFFISTPADIFHSFWGSVQDGSLFYHAGITSIEALGGFALGSAIGMTLGLMLGRFETLAKILDPFLMGFYSLPKAALAPLFILWFGIGLDMKIYLAASIVFFLVFLNTFTGVRNVSREQISILRLMGATERHLITKVVIPSAVTWVFAGLRLSVPYALIGAIVGEIIAANRGLGFLLAHATGEFDTAGTFAALFAIMILALLLNVSVNAIEKALLPWKTVEAEREITV